HMKKFLGSILLSSLLVSALSAEGIIIPVNYEAQIAKMNKYINAVMGSNLTNSALYNISYPRTNVVDTDKELVYQFDLAGVPKENIKLTIDENNLLTLEGEKKSSNQDKTKNYVKQEIFYGSFQKTIKLPENVDKDKLETKYNDGILTVTISKVEIKKPKAKVIPIK
ncbi:MAG: HSP20 family protein, partial [Sulfurimonas sp.]